MKEARRLALGAVIIVRNEEEKLGFVLSDLEGIVDEIVVVDTGSEDRTIEVARSYGARVGFFTWCDDFSAARNKSIELAESDYLIWIDADDRIDNKNRKKILELKGMLRPEKDRCYMLKVISRCNEGPSTVAFQPRIFPNRDDVRFEGKVHEQIAPCMGKCGIIVEEANIAIEHTGYHNNEEAREKARRNLGILLDERGQGREDAMHLFRIAMSYYALSDYQRCLKYLEQARQNGENENWYKYNFIVAAECYARMNNPENALHELRQAVRRYPESGVVYYFLGALHLKTGRVSEAIPALEKAASLGIEPDVFPLPSDLRERVVFQYGMALEKAGRMDEAVRAYRASLEVNPHYMPSLKYLGMALLNTGNISDAITCLEEARGKCENYDRLIWLCLARAYFFSQRFNDAHHMYLRSVKEDHEDKDILTGLIQTSIEMNDFKALQSSLESLMELLGMNTEREINTRGHLADLCAETALKLFDRHDSLLAKRLAESALRIDGSCSSAYLVCADFAFESEDAGEGISCLEKALRNGASPDLVTERMKKIGKR